jgi:hypothetical protein
MVTGGDVGFGDGHRDFELQHRVDVAGPMAQGLYEVRYNPTQRPIHFEQSLGPLGRRNHDRTDVAIDHLRGRLVIVTAYGRITR